MFKLSRRIISVGLSAGFILLIIIFVIIQQFRKPEDTTTVFNKGVDLFVERVVDGDTFVLSTGEKVRLLGIDTPEKYESKKLNKDAEMSGQDKKTIKKLGMLASDYVKGFVEGKKVRLEKEPNYDDKDRYGRLLRYIYLEDGTFVNGKIIRDGYAQVYEKYPISKLDELRKYQREARENQRGLWGKVEGLEQFK
ncbi:MAG: thermonuclease family protein [Ignavibacteriae bacterium]|nr:thermonuclease family protein [Ignavibacteriota bacterium]